MGSLVFSFDSDPSILYYAEKDMIWEDWVKSKYNTIEAYIDDDGNVYTGWDDQIGEPAGRGVYALDPIINNTIYLLL
jgi:hypothetical protein